MTAQGPVIGVLLMVLGAGLAATAALAPVVEGAIAHRPLAAVVGGAVGWLSLSSLVMADIVEASCDGTCGRSAETLYISGLGGLVGCVGLAAALHWRAPSVLRWLVIVAGMVSWVSGVAT